MDTRASRGQAILELVLVATFLMLSVFAVLSLTTETAEKVIDKNRFSSKGKIDWKL